MSMHGYSKCTLAKFDLCIWMMCKNGKLSRSSQPTVAIKQESSLAIGQVCLEVAIVCGSSGTKGQ